MITGGVLLVAHGWWSGLEEANAQRTLAAEAPTPSAGASASLPTPHEAPLAPLLSPLGGWRPPGQVPQLYADLSIPSIGLSSFVVRGATLTDYYDLLAWGPAHLVNTPEPGALGNAVIFGHVDEFGAPFRRLASLRPGDLIDLRQGAALYEYAVQAVATVPATDLGIVANRPGVRALTLFTCGGPANSDRVAVTAVLAKSDQAPPTGAPG